MADDDRLEALEKRLAELQARLEESGQKIGDELEERIGKITTHRRRHRDRTGLFWGLVFVVAGFIWLGNQVHWFDIDIPFWPTVLIVIGLYIIFSSQRD